MKIERFLPVIFVLIELAACGGGGGTSTGSSSSTSSTLTQQQLAGPWHFAMSSTLNSGTNTSIEANLLGDGSPATVPVTFSTFRHMVAFLKPSPAPLSNGGPVIAGGNIPVWGGFGGDMNMSLQLQVGGNSVSLSATMSNIAINGSGTITADGNQITGTYQFSDNSDRGTFTAAKVPRWDGTYAGTITNDFCFPSPSQFSIVLTENADFTVSVAGLPSTCSDQKSTGLTNGFAIGNLILLPQDSDKPANLLGLRADNTGVFVNFWEEGAPPFAYLGVLKKQ